MPAKAVTHVRQHAEKLATLSLTHLSAATRLKLARDELSVNAYPTTCGGFVYVGSPRFRIPAETDLAELFEIAEAAGVTGLMFDQEAAVVDGLTSFADPNGSP